ncbi:MAG: hypothetical protein WAK71_00180 [Streptosporangiaceae bacterium]
MELISAPGPDGSPPRIEGWPDSGAVATITWSTASGELQQQETASEQEAVGLLAKIAAADDLDLVNAQLRRLGIGPDS